MLRSIELVIPLPVSANRLYRSFSSSARCSRCGANQRGSSRPILSAEARKYTAEIKTLVFRSLGTPEPMTKRLAVTLVLHFKDRRSTDIANREKILTDALQAANVIADDSLIDRYTIIRGELDKDNPRGVITIEEIE